MKVIKFDPTKTLFPTRNDFFSPFENAFNSMFDDMLSNFPEAVKSTASSRRYPKTDVYKEGDNLVFESVVPFMEKEGLEISLEDNTLTISGECGEEESKKEGREFFIKELKRSKFKRSWVIPEDIMKKSPEVTAKFNEGRLFVTLEGAYKEKEEKKSSKVFIDIK